MFCSEICTSESRLPTCAVERGANLLTKKVDAMTPQLSHFMRVAKRVSAAAGYLELGMSQHTLDCLENLGDVGPFEADVDILRGAAFGLQHRFPEADVALATAVEKSPAPEDKLAWIALSICYNEAGNTAKALQMLAPEGRRHRTSRWRLRSGSIPHAAENGTFRHRTTLAQSASEGKLSSFACASG